MTTTLFHHPDAGRDDRSPEHLLAALRAVGIDANYASLEGDDWRGALAATDDLAIAAGGDGTVVQIAAGLRGRDCPMAILPTGSANNIARALGAFDDDLDVLIRGLAGASYSTLSAMEAAGSWGRRTIFEAIGLGALTRAVAELQNAELDGAHKHESGMAAFRDALVGESPLQLDLRLDDAPLSEPVLLIELLKLPLVGPNLRLVPDVDPAAGLFCAAWLPEAGRDAMLAWLDGEGPPDALPPLTRRLCRSATFTAEREPLRLGDKTIDWDGTGVSVTCDPDLVTILIPRR